MTQLSVNLNKIALLRNARGIGEPNVTEFAQLALNSGAYGVTIHPRPDQRHATYQDAHDLKALLSERFSNRELNIEGYPDEKWLETVLAIKPEQATLIPDEPGQLTSDHGWDLTKPHSKLNDIIKQLQSSGIRVSLFLDPILEQVELAKTTLADRIELYTEPYARAFESGNADKVVAQYAAAATHAEQIGLGVNAGHDLNLKNIGYFCEHVRVQEVSIGHALTCESLINGFTHTVANYVEILSNTK